MDGNSKRIEVDSASTAKEAIEQLSANLDLKDSFGFSMFVTILDKALSLGSENEHILDAISNCEQYMKEQGGNEKTIAWRLLMRKEVFSPWYNPNDCPVSTELIYRQVVTGVATGEFRCKAEKEFAMLAALQHYVDLDGQKLDTKILRKSIPKYIPKDLIQSGDKSIDKWENLITSAFKNSPKIIAKIPTIEAKEDIVVYAQLTWACLFSRYYECVLFQGPDLPSKNLVIAINSSGIFLLNNQEVVVCELSYAEILSVSHEGGEKIDCLFINTVQKVEFGFKCFEANVIEDLIVFMINGLKTRSVYAVALQNYSHPDNMDTYLKLIKGDLIKLGHGYTGASINPSDLQWAFGESRGKSGDFPTEAVYVLPCIEPPSQEVLDLFKVKLD